jgi:hypothetical protein
LAAHAAVLGVFRGVFFPEWLFGHVVLLLADYSRSCAPFHFTAAASAPPSQIKGSKFKKFRVIFKMPKTKVAVLAKRTPYHAGPMVMVNDNFSHRAADNAFANRASLIRFPVFRFLDTGRDAGFATIFITARATPAI